MVQIYLSQVIDNESGYVDSVIDEIKAVPSGETLEMLITCEGGDVFQGARLQRSIAEHVGHTKAVVIGLAASMAGVLLAEFDDVEFDEESDVMLHQAHMSVDALNEDQKAMILRFNKRAYGRMLAAGVNEKLLSDVFLGEPKDIWLTAKEAEAAGLGKVVRIERRDGKPFKVAAQLKNFKNKNTDMGLFDKPVMRILTVADGRQVVFNSKKEIVQKGDKLSLVGSGDSLKGELRLSATLVAEIGDDNEVKAINEVAAPAAVVDDQAFADLQAMVADLTETVKGILEKMGATEETAPEAAAAQLAAIDEKTKELEAATTTVKALLDQTLKAAATISTSFKLEKVENKSESIFNGLTPLQAQAKKLREVLKSK